MQQTGLHCAAEPPEPYYAGGGLRAALYLAIVKKFEPLLLLPIAFGMLLTNLPGAGMYHAEFFANGEVDWASLGALTAA